MRLIRRFTQAIIKILKAKDEQNFDIAFDEIKKVYNELIGIDPMLINSFSIPQIIEFLNKNPEYKKEKGLIVAKLLKEEGELVELKEKDSERSLALYLKSFNLFTELLNDNFNDAGNYLDDINHAANRLKNRSISGEVKYKLFRYFEVSGSFAEAENILYDLIDSEYPGIINEAEQFYNRLEAKSDEELLNGNLPRYELNEGKQYILRKKIY